MARKTIVARKSSHTGWIVGVCALLIALIWTVFGQTLHHQFINYDDSTYVYENPAIKQGLTVQSLAWAFTHSHGGNWHPLTSISHELDCQLYGLNAGDHHLGNVALHTVAVLVLFLLLRFLTGALWRSAVVAALFAIHPLRVESVAWIAERKDVLSGLFFVLSLGCYVLYVRQPSRFRYLVALVAFACGLMSKPMLVTLPLILLVLDYWPLNRWPISQTMAKGRRVESSRNPTPTIRQLLLEKLPFFALAAISGVITLLVQKQAIATVTQLPLGWRILNAFQSSLVYLWEMIWPVKLGLFYPFPDGDSLIGRGLLSCAALVSLSVLIFAAGKNRPYLLAGWLWYLIMLLPVIGVIQVGMQAHADRYTYLPHIGLYLALVWGITDLSAEWAYRREIFGTCAALLVAGLTFLAWKQASYWRDSEAIWSHTLAVTERNGVAEAGLADALVEQHRYEEAIPDYEDALKLKPDDEQSETNLAYAFRMMGRLDEAIACFKKAAQLSASEPPLKQATAHNNLGNALMETKQVDQAIGEFQQAVALAPNEEEETNLANALFRKGRVGDAIAQYETALKFNPNSSAVLTYLSWALVTAADASVRNGPRAVELATRANHLAGQSVPSVGRSLAAAEAEVGNFSEAIAVAQNAIELAESQHDQRMLTVLKKELARYQSGQPYHASAN